MTPRKAPRAFVVAASAALAQALIPGVAAADTPAPPFAPASLSYAATSPAAPDNAISATDQLVAPIALYPDPLIALILPASTVPADISAAQGYLVQYGDRTRIDSQPWDPSVRGLAHYPAVIGWMAENPEWTQALGAAFLASPPEVMDSIQHVRARALAAGILGSNAQQQVYSGNGVIEILPAQSDSISIPAYDAGAVSLADPGEVYGSGFIDYGTPYVVGPWLSCCLDWSAGAVWIGEWSAWHGSTGWYRPRFHRRHGPDGAKPWHPKESTSMPTPLPRGAVSLSVPHPRPMQGAPAMPARTQIRSDGYPAARPGTAEGHPVLVDSRYAAPAAPSRAAEGVPAPARAPAPATAPHMAAAPAAAPAARASSPPPSTASDPKNR
jgi:hypothetical protein